MNSDDKLKKYRQEYYEKNKEKIKEYDRKWKKENRNIAYQKEYNIKNVEKIKQRDRKNYIKNQKIQLFRSAKRRSIEHNLPFDIDLNYIETVWPIDNICPIRKVKLIVGTNQSRNDSPSIDRIIPHLGYIKNNIVIMSYLANKTKADASIKELKKIKKNIKNKPTIHEIDNLTMKDIQECRIKNSINKSYANKYRILNLEYNLLINAKRRANKKHIEFNLTKDYIKSIWPLSNKCPFTNKPFTIGKNGYRNSASIDRIDPTIGYVENNIQIVSLQFNSMKNCLKMDEEASGR